MKHYSRNEEIANAVTHGIGVLFSVVTMTLLLVFAYIDKNPLGIVAFAIYGACSFLLYSASTLYHSIPHPRVKPVLRVFDHSAIYLYIAGTYTPVALLALDGAWRLGMLIAVWAIAIAGIVFKIVTFKNFDRFKVLSLIIYIGMGWLAVIAIKPMLAVLPLGFFFWLLGGGLFYTLGTIFYASKKMPFNHAVWHLFVLAGSVCQFFAIFLYLR